MICFIIPILTDKILGLKEDKKLNDRSYFNGVFIDVQADVGEL